MKSMFLVYLAFLLHISLIKTTTRKTTTKKNCNYGTVLDGKICRECGLRNLLNNVTVVNGTEAVKHSWPAQAFVKADSMYLSYIKLSFKCGGTLISRRTVVTAAHCLIDMDGKTVKPANVTVVLGLDVYPVNGVDFDSNAVFMRVAKVILHPNYAIDKRYNDIALLILSNHAQLNDNIKIACLPSGPSAIYPHTKDNAWVVGWGTLVTYFDKYELLRNEKTPILAASVCKKRIPKFLNDSQICAGETAIQNTFRPFYAFGSPLYVLENIGGKSRYVVSGVLSNSNNHPRIYTRVSYFYDWIVANQML